MYHKHVVFFTDENPFPSMSNTCSQPLVRFHILFIKKTTQHRGNLHRNIEI